jgi:succinoglycan biosynthesis protein ExoU
MSPAAISVIIAAHRAGDTIHRAVTSALAQPEVTEVIVVDDASDDATADRAWDGDDGTGRLSVIRCDANRGPAAARNLALSRSAAPLVAVLDADDFFLPGRFARLAALPEHDLLADNIAFVTPAHAAALTVADLPDFPPQVTVIGAAAFAAGNLARRGVQRGELGFLKPVMSRAFLDRHDLRYDPDLRLGEDYDLYMRMLLAGARFGVTQQVGYAAVVRAGSLSARHRTGDLAALMRASARHLTAPGLTPEARLWIGRHLRATRAKYLLRACLDRKTERGLLAALRFALAPPSRFGPIMAGVLQDKRAAFRRDPSDAPALRFLLGPSPG